MENEILLEILGEVKGLKSDMGSVKSDISGMKSEIKNMNSRMDKLEDTISLFKKDVDKRFDDLSEGIDYTFTKEIISVISKTQKDVENVRKEIDMIRPFVAEHELYINHLKKAR